MHAPISPSFMPSRVTLSVDGAVEGYASLFGEIDQARDMVMPGAFQKTLAERSLPAPGCGALLHARSLAGDDARAARATVRRAD